MFGIYNLNVGPLEFEFSVTLTLTRSQQVKTSRSVGRLVGLLDWLAGRVSRAQSESSAARPLISSGAQIIRGHDNTRRHIEATETEEKDLPFPILIPHWWG